MSDGGRGSTHAGAICFDPNNGGKVIFGGGYSPTQGNGTKFAVSQLGGVYQGGGSNLTATNFIGISSAAYADTATQPEIYKGALQPIFLVNSRNYILRSN